MNMGSGSWKFPHTCQIKRRTGVDGFGKSVHGEPETTPCRFQRKQKLVRGLDGQERMAQAQVWLPPSTGISADDVIVYPVNSGQEYTVLNIGDAESLYGKPDHVKAYC